MTFKKHIPNSITCLNLISGSIAIVYALQHNYTVAAWLILLAAGFDFLDGFAARMLHANSPIGKELDSLADVISFGLAPGMMVFASLSTALETLQLPTQWAWFAFLMPAFSALRLAKFNLDDRQTSSFLGLPTPANALFWAFGLAYSITFLSNPVAMLLLIGIALILTSTLLVSEIPMFSLKFKSYDWKRNQTAYIFMGGCLLLLITMGIHAVSICLMWYVILSILTGTRSKKND